ncbi:MAG: CerR family C-terminal domain-containing protein [Aquabacterium sp.]|nr:CerR family C-terminal domain-containing protein [Aquabacterium sp.]
MVLPPSKPAASGVLPRTLPASPPATQPGTEPDPARARLIRAGLRLFAHQGFTATSTRELAQAAGVNVAAISYYFGDKAGLYRAVFFEPLGEIADDITAFSNPQLSLEDALRGFFAGFIEPLALGEDGQLCVKLRMREMIEPTGLWDQEVNEGLRPMHVAMLAVLCRHLGLAGPDNDLHRLVICLTALGVHLHLGRDVTDAVAPQLNQAADAPARWADCLLQQGLAMVDHAQRRRAAAAPPAAQPKA